MRAILRHPTRSPSLSLVVPGHILPSLQFRARTTRRHRPRSRRRIR